ncbi:MAG: hypothetical protein NTU41_13705 [Chloroflexi bacterium]|nr:hypothetical protein [Chloroflexota bacterium]
MVKVKEMPYSEKYAKVVDQMKFDEGFILPLVQKGSGDQAAAELKKLWQEGVKPIPEGASFEEKYGIAYSNWIWMAKSAYGLTRQRMGEDGIEKFERAEIEALKKRNAGPALFLLRLMRAILPGTAFTMTVKQMAYQMQWIAPMSVSELTGSKAVLNIPRCKILDFPDVEDICLVGCQSTNPLWIAEQFKAKMAFERQGHSCTCTVAPLR